MEAVPPPWTDPRAEAWYEDLTVEHRLALVEEFEAAGDDVAVEVALALVERWRAVARRDAARRRLAELRAAG